MGNRECKLRERTTDKARVRAVKKYLDYPLLGRLRTLDYANYQPPMTTRSDVRAQALFPLRRITGRSAVGRGTVWSCFGIHRAQQVGEQRGSRRVPLHLRLAHPVRWCHETGGSLIKRSTSPSVFSDFISSFSTTAGLQPVRDKEANREDNFTLIIFNLFDFSKTP